MDSENNRSNGGKVRAAKLSKERRSEIAREGALAKHAKAQTPKLPTASHKGVLKLGGSEIACFVLEDGRRVISGRGMTSAIGMLGRGSGVARISGMKAVKSVAEPSFLQAIASPIEFIGESPRKDVPSHGFEAPVLQDLCEVLLKARDAGMLATEHEIRYAQFADTLIRSFARVGIVALVDEATGYQEERPKDALQAYLEKIISEELASWVKKFPDEFYENIYKLRGWTWPGMSKNRYSVVGTYTRDLVFERIAPGLLPELERKSPKNEKGQRANKLHQWLTEDIGDPMLAQHMHSLIMFQRLAIANGFGWNRFVKMVDQVLPKKGSTLELPLDDVI
ncbi:P63C domain-containing protein [Duganella sp. CF402]|uniref:P63C domain-containing protein n=1 Tax=unclassified Duganella TaxID=2636909 RepID=UPI0008BC06C3|nr:MULTISPECIES: P63C domain-containing protein [unclassified Duganella]RZT04577.1 P63C domain-containing protein [Duganella sp. BK701]SEM31525.1 P63C domain-containing protein [Duganella sp. CF402]